jgi:osmoprotectant transport system permease protein
LGNLEHATTAKSALRAAGDDDGASSPDAVARWLWERIGKR